jgi:hypothetical protein
MGPKPHVSVNIRVVGSNIDRYRYVFVGSGQLLLATGASFTELTVIEIVALFDTNPLLSFTV